MAKVNVHVFLVLKYCIDTSLWQRTKTLLWYNCCQIENIQGIISVHFPVCLNVLHRDTNFHRIIHTHNHKHILFLHIITALCFDTHTKTLNIHASWLYLSYLEGTSNAAAFQLNSFSRVFEPSDTQHRKSNSLSSCAWFKTQELKSY